MPDSPIIIIGAGLSGLACARTLHRAGRSVMILEQSDGLGGRIRTDHVEGFLLDRGFQVYLSAYPEGRAQFDYAKLDLRPFEPGAAVWFDGKLHTVMDPWRRPGSLLDGALAKVGTLADKLRVGALRSRLQRESPEARYARPETSVMALLKHEGFSEAMIDRFFRPFFGGIFFDPDLATSSRMMEFVFRCFASGDATVPALGMQQLPEQLASDLPPGSIRLNTKVEAISGSAVYTVDVGTNQRQPFEASAVVNAAPDCLFLARATGGASLRDRGWRSVTNVYFAGQGKPPVEGPLLMLDGEHGRPGHGPAMNVVVMSNVSPNYAPPGQFLLSCSLIGLHGSDAEHRTREQLSHWFGPTLAAGLRHLRTYRIEKALPDQTAPYYTSPANRPCQVRPGVYSCGDTHETASIDGALVSGRHAAEAILQGN